MTAVNLTKMTIKHGKSDTLVKVKLSAHAVVKQRSLSKLLQRTIHFGLNKRVKMTTIHPKNL